MQQTYFEWISFVLKCVCMCARIVSMFSVTNCFKNHPQWIISSAAAFCYLYVFISIFCFQKRESNIYHHFHKNLTFWIHQGFMSLWFSQSHILYKFEQEKIWRECILPQFLKTMKLLSNASPGSRKEVKNWLSEAPLTLCVSIHTPFMP